MSGRASSSQRMPTSAVPSSSSATAISQRSPRGRKPGPSQLGHRDRAGRDLVLHVDRAPAPQPAALVDDRGERRMGPVARVGRDHVECGRRTPATAPTGPIPGIRATRFARRGSRATSSQSTPAPVR